jgi:hypothetical protein
MIAECGAVGVYCCMKIIPVQLSGSIPQACGGSDDIATSILVSLYVKLSYSYILKEFEKEKTLGPNTEVEKEAGASSKMRESTVMSALNEMKEAKRVIDIGGMKMISEITSHNLKRRKNCKK